MRSQLKTAITILLTVLLAAAAFCVILFWYPYHRASTQFPKDRQVVLQQLKNGALEISWPEAKNADRYTLEILIPGENGSYQPEYIGQITGQSSHTVYNLNADSLRTIRISAVSEYAIPFSDTPGLRVSEDPIVITGVFSAPQIEWLNWIPDPETNSVSVALSLGQNCVARLYETTPGIDSKPAQMPADGKTTLYFGDEAGRPIPSYTQPYTFAFDAYRQAEGYIFYGIRTEPLTLTRQDLLGTELHLTGTEDNDNRFTLTWNEVKGDYYQLQHRLSEAEPWKTLAEIPADGERTYTTQSLSPYCTQEYRVITQRKDATADSMPVTQSNTLQISTQSKLIYSTVWPIKDLPVYTNAAATAELGTAKAGTAFCVLALEYGKFRVRYKTGEGYIDSNYCMINLPEFLGDLCSYNITNSYDSLYKIHQYDIPNVTGTVIAGYEQVQLAPDTYLVPLLYPTARKLEQAALAAKAEGYTLKIYDSFRPQATTLALYEQAGNFVEETIPQDQLPENYTGTGAYTYAMYMTDNGRYSLSFFLSKERSRHNQGVAVDMTLVDAFGELPMQTDIHDLSWFSETAQNKSNANTMARFMKDAGFGTLTSEWWHFQDDDTMTALNVPALMSGVTPECWMADDTGWRYRRADGLYCTNCTLTIDGVQYRFDQNGYIIN